MNNIALTPGSYYDCLTSEVIENSLNLPQELHNVLCRYYHSLVKNVRNRLFYRYNWQRRTAPMYFLLRSLPQRSKPWRILDAGCGVGTEALLWGTLRNDVEVTGVDINQERLTTAKERLRKLQIAKGQILPVQFRHGNVFDLLTSSSFDLIWSMEAISHIDPAEQFLSAAFESLNTSGKLVISDSHSINPAMLWRVFKLRRNGFKRTYKRLPGGQYIPYAQERLFSVSTLARLMRRAGFIDVQSQLSVYFPPFTARSQKMLAACMLADRVFDQLPLVRYIGGIYTLIGTKQNG
jgi:2-polyprenyl-3-methyl-5-hydroxy-6-metoxy-1,4-benzoquinol methylase